MVLDATYTDGTLFRSLMGAMQELIDECLITVSKAGLRISRLDKDQVVMVDLWLPRESFLRYSFRHNETEQEFGISVKELKKVMTWMTADAVQIKANVRDLVFTQKQAGVYSERTLQLPCIANVSHEEEAQPPAQDYQATASFSNQLFSKLLRSHMENHDTVALTIEKTKFSFELNGHEQINGKTTLHRSTDHPDNPVLKIETKIPKVRQLMATAHFKKFAAASDLASSVEIQMVGGEDPMKVNFHVGDDSGYLAFYIAPKIETEG